MNKKRIDLVGKNICTGCGACFNKCPVNAIQMKKDQEGFLYPQIVESKCINCGLCYETCPAVSYECDEEKSAKYYAVMAEDTIRMESSSGGVVTLLAEKVIEEGGCICGAEWKDDFHVEHTVIEKLEDIGRIRKSKYVQSDMRNIYRKIENILKEDRSVVFTGCPCQVAGMRKYFGDKYSKLLLVDIVCHGVPSQTALSKYIEEKQEIGNIEKIDFRDKNEGWGSIMKIMYKNGYIYNNDCFHDLYYRGFLGGIITRPSCSSCKYASMNRVGDITVGDFWGVAEVDKGLNDNKGTGLAIVNSKKGEEFFKEVLLDLKKFEQVSKEKVRDIAKRRNGRLLMPKEMNPSHYRFFDLLEKMKFSKAFDYAANWRYDIGILGWWANLNYGGTLTYFALYSALKRIGYEVMMIESPRDDGKEPQQDTVPRRFARKHYKISKVYSHTTMPILNNHCKAFISGSDQLWNPVLRLWSDPVYFMSFANDNRLKISYGSSFGNSTTASKEFVDEFAPMMKRFNGISVREDYGVDVCREIFGVDAVQVCDPVFLCERDVYESVIKDAELKFPDKFILNFILDPDEKKRQLILDLSSEFGIDYVNFTDLQFVEDKVKAFDLKNTYGNAEIENLVKAYRDAEFVITDSFHGTCFSIIFNKPFISIANEGRGVKRFESLMRWLNLEDRIVYDISDIKNRPELFSPIDYERVNEVIRGTREESMRWLKKQLEHIDEIRFE